MRAVDNNQAEQAKKMMGAAQEKMERSMRAFDGTEVAVPKVVKGAEAEAIADKPKLTGDPEWDAIELEATSDSQEPFPDHWLDGLT